MEVSDARDHYYKASGKASDVARQLAFGAIAAAWLFKADATGGGFTLPNLAIAAGVCTGMALLFDLLQYTFAAGIWGYTSRLKEKQLGPKGSFAAPRWFNWPAIVCFWFKVACVLVGYVLLIVQLGYSIR